MIPELPARFPPPPSTYGSSTPAPPVTPFPEERRFGTPLAPAQPQLTPEGNHIDFGTGTPWSVHPQQPQQRIPPALPLYIPPMIPHSSDTEDSPPTKVNKKGKEHNPISLSSTPSQDPPLVNLVTPATAIAKRGGRGRERYSTTTREEKSYGSSDPPTRRPNTVRKEGPRG